MQGYHFDRSGAQRIKDTTRNYIHPDASNSQKSTPPKPGRPYEPDEVVIRNDTGNDIPDLGVVRYGDYILSSDFEESTFRNSPVLEGLVPDDSGKFGIVRGYLTEDSTGRIVVSGVTPARIEVSNEAHEYCSPTDGNVDRMESGDAGPAEILWKESGTGTKLALILIGNSTPSSGSTQYHFIGEVVTATFGETDGDFVVEFEQMIYPFYGVNDANPLGLTPGDQVTVLNTGGIYEGEAGEKAIVGYSYLAANPAVSLYYCINKGCNVPNPATQPGGTV